jgi:copper(I)-binding protein
MKRLILAAALLAAAATASAKDYAAGPLAIVHPWARPAAAGLTSAGYLTIVNKGKTADVLVSVEAAGARSASLHRSMMEGQVMTMQSMNKGLAIGPGQTVALAPGGDHIMLTGLKKGLNPGDRVPIVLVFQRAGRIAIDLTVETGAAGPKPRS